MKSLDQILNYCPQVVGDESGSEPSLYIVLCHYYTSHGMTFSKASTCARDYIAELKKYAEK